MKDKSSEERGGFSESCSRSGMLLCVPQSSGQLQLSYSHIPPEGKNRAQFKMAILLMGKYST